MKYTALAIVALALFCSSVEAKKNKKKQADEEAAAEESETSGSLTPSTIAHSTSSVTASALKLLTENTESGTLLFQRVSLEVAPLASVATVAFPSSFLLSSRTPPTKQESRLPTS